MIGMREENSGDVSDLRLIDRYLARELTEREAQAFERRLVQDEAFFEKASPLIGLFWFGAGRAEVRVVEARGLARELRAALVDESVRILPTPRTLKWVWGLAAAVFLAGISVPVVGRYEQARSQRREAEGGFARTDWMMEPERLQAADSVVTATFKDGSEAVVSRGGHFTSRGLNLIGPMFDTAAVAVDGDVAFRLGAKKDSARIRTPEVDAEVTPGTYRIHAIPKSGSTTIWVDSGRATVFGLVAPKQAVTLNAGEHATFWATGRMP